MQTVFTYDQVEQKTDAFLKGIATRILILEASKTLKKNNPNIVAVAGSVGKTSTQEALYQIFEQVRTTRHTTGDYNAIVGACRTVLNVPTAGSNIAQWVKNLYHGALRAYSNAPYPMQLVIEAGISKPGRMSKFKFLSPHVVVYTRFPNVPAHTGNFRTPEEVIAEKLLLKNSLRSDGLLVVNADDPAMRNITVTENQMRVSYGMSADATFRGSSPQLVYEGFVPVGVQCSVTYQSETQLLLLKGVFGTHHVYPVLAAIAVAVSQGMSLQKAVSLTEGYKGPNGRMHLLEGVNDSILIDDTYNSSPAALAAGVATVDDIEWKGRKVCVLGDMLELGSYTSQAHKKAVEQASHVCDALVLIGDEIRSASEQSTLDDTVKKTVYFFDSADRAAAEISKIVEVNDLVYLKGSGGMHVERVTKALLAEQERAKELLVRQPS